MARKKKPEPATTYTPIGSQAGFVAASKIIDLSNRNEIAKMKRKETWEEVAWAIADTVGEVNFALTTLSNIISRVRLYPAKLPSSSSDVSTTAPPDITKNRQVVEAFERLSPSGDFSDLLYDTTFHFTVVGDCYLIGKAQDPETGGEESWAIYSKDELKLESNKLHIVDENGYKIYTLKPKDTAIRLWLRHPRFHSRNTSPIASILSPAEILIILERATRAVGKSRIIQSGFVRVANEIIPPPVATDDGADPQNPMQAWLENFAETVYAPIENEGSGSAAAPIFVHGPHEILKDTFTHEEIKRPFDEMLDTMMERAIRRIAQGLPVPPEVVLGMSDMSHWSAWAVQEDFFHSHAEPMLLKVLKSWNDGYFRPMLRAMGVANPNQYAIWYDASNLIFHPNKTRDILTANDQNLASDMATRAVLGLKESDAPDKLDLLDKVLFERAAYDPILTAALLKKRVGIDVLDDIKEAQSPDPNFTRGRVQGDQPVDVGVDNSGRMPKMKTTQSAPSTRKDGQNSNLTASIVGATSIAISTALTKAGARIRQRAVKNKALTAAIDGLPNSLVPSTIGRQKVAELNYSDEELFEGCFTELDEQLRSWGISKTHSSIISSHARRLSLERAYLPNAHRDLPFNIDSSAMTAIEDAVEAIED